MTPADRLALRCPCPIHRDTLPSGAVALSRDDAGVPVPLTRSEAAQVASEASDAFHAASVEPVRFTRGFYVRVERRGVIP